MYDGESYAIDLSSSEVTILSNKILVTPNYIFTPMKVYRVFSNPGKSIYTINSTNLFIHHKFHV